MQLERSVLLPCSFEEMRQAVLKPQTLAYVAAPLVRFRWLDPDRMPARFDPGRYKVGMRLFGVLPMGWQIIDPVIADDAPQAGRFVLHDRGDGMLCRQWDHRILLVRQGTQCHYTDRLSLNAGLLTPAVTGFAWLFFRHRQRRLIKLCRSR